MAAVYWLARRGVRSPAPRRLLFFALIFLGVVSVALGCYQRFVQPGWLMLGRAQVEQFMDRASGPFGIPNSLAGFLILLLPAVGALAFRPRAVAIERVWWSWVLLVFAFGLWLTVSRGGWIALAIALVVWPLIQRNRRWPKRAVAAIVVLALVVAAGAVLYSSAPGVRNRFDRLVRDSGELSRPILWRAAVGIFSERPIVGGGAGSYNVRFEAHRPEGFVDDPQWAHNEYLNTLSDYGLIGLVLLAGAVGLMIAQSRRRSDESRELDHDWIDSRFVRSGFAIGALAFGLQAFVDFHLKIPALAMTLAVVGAMVPRPPASSSERSASRLVRVGWVIAAGGVALALFPVTSLYRAEAMRYGARQRMDAVASRSGAEITAAISRVESDLQRAVGLAPYHAGAWSDLAFALELRAFADPAQTSQLATPAADAARHAVALADQVPEIWIRLGVALDMQGRRPDAAAAFEKAVKLAPKNSRAWYYYANHLSFATDQRDAALRAIATSLSLDPGNRAAEALHVKLNERSPGAFFIP
jgi:cytochrome c-type biogenesis protein CcmH/NrfG